MRKIRISGVNLDSCHLYRCFEGQPGFSYQEDEPIENARRLSEGEVDVALIPIPAYFEHGGYEGLDFGLGCRIWSSLFLCAHEPVEKLKTIFLYEGSSASAFLLKLELRDIWNVSPKLIRSKEQEFPVTLAPTEGVLIRAEPLVSVAQRYPVREDLVRRWNETTGLPFTFLVWAARPGVFNRRHYQFFHETCHRAVVAQEQGIIYRGETQAPHPANSNYFYYFNSEILASIAEFARRGHAARLFPGTPYVRATQPVLATTPRSRPHERPLVDLLEDVVAGRRLSVAEGIRLAVEASVADLGLVADLLGQRVTESRSVEVVLLSQGSALEQPIHPRVHRLRLVQASGGFSLADILSQLRAGRAAHGLPIEGPTVGTILALAEQEGLSPPALVQQILEAGGGPIDGTGGGLLLERWLRRAEPAYLGAADYLSVMRWAQRLGGGVSCGLPIRLEDTWEERLLHLQKLRALQDENPGFCYATVRMLVPDAQNDPGLRLRALLMMRLFLDNIPLVYETSLRELRSRGPLDLCFGVNSVQILIERSDQQFLEEALEGFKELDGFQSLPGLRP